MADSRAKDMVVERVSGLEEMERESDKVFYSNSITGRPLLNGRSVTFLIWTIVCLSSSRLSSASAMKKQRQGFVSWLDLFVDQKHLQNARSNSPLSKQRRLEDEDPGLLNFKLTSDSTSHH